MFCCLCGTDIGDQLGLCPACQKKRHEARKNELTQLLTERQKESLDMLVVGLIEFAIGIVVLVGISGGFEWLFSIAVSSKVVVFSSYYRCVAVLCLYKFFTMGFLSTLICTALVWRSNFWENEGTVLLALVLTSWFLLVLARIFVFDAITDMFGIVDLPGLFFGAAIGRPAGMALRYEWGPLRFPIVRAKAASAA